MRLAVGRRVGFVCLGLAAGWSGAACSSPAANPNAALPASSLVTTALRNTVGTGWVHEAFNATGTGHTISMDNDIGTATGRQVIDADGAHAMVIVLDDAAYIEGDAQAMTSYFGFPSSRQLAGKWIAIGHSDNGYSTVRAAVTLKSDFSQVVITGPLKKEPVTVIDGRSVVPIVGTIAGATGGDPVPATLYVTATGVILPIELRAGNARATETTVWSNWGRSVRITAPPGPIPISTVGG